MKIVPHELSQRIITMTEPAFFSNYEMEALRLQLEKKAEGRQAARAKLSQSAHHRRVRRQLADKLEAARREITSRVIVTKGRNPLAFGSTAPRLDTSQSRLAHQDEISVMQTKYGVSIVSHNSTIPSMDPRVVMGPIFSNYEAAGYEAGAGRSAPADPYFGFETAPSSPGGSGSPLRGTLRPKTQGTLDWKRCPSPERPPVKRFPYRDTLSYNAVEAESTLVALGRLAADTRHLSPAFASNTKRFVLPTPQAPDKFTYPIERDAQRWTDATKCCSPFTSKTTRESPLISIPGPRDPTEFGFKYDPDVYPKPSVAKEVAEQPARYATAFRSKDERFKDPKAPYANGLGPNEFQDAYLKPHGKSVRSFVMGKYR